MAELKTRPETTSVPAFLASIADESRRRDREAVAALMREVTGVEPVMWGTSNREVLRELVRGSVDAMAEQRVDS